MQKEKISKIIWHICNFIRLFLNGTFNPSKDKFKMLAIGTENFKDLKNTHQSLIYLSNCKHSFKNVKKRSLLTFIQGCIEP